MTKAAAPIEQLALGGLRLRSEPRTPVAKLLERDAVRPAILPLVQVTMLPRLMMPSPECLALPRPRSVLLRHLVLSICKSKARTDCVCQQREQACEKWTLL